MKLEEIAGVIITVLQEAGLPFMVVGGLSSNVYSIARSTKDVIRPVGFAQDPLLLPPRHATVTS